MYIGIMNPVFGQLTLEEMCKTMADLGVYAIEMGCGGYPGTKHCDAAELIADEKKYQEFMATLDKYGMKVAALATHNNPVSPVAEVAKKADEELTAAFKLAQKMGVETVVGFAGCPGDGKGGTQPNWVTCSWPPEYMEILDYQWNEVLIPYWKEKVKEAEACGVRIAFEMHPGFCVYNPYTALKLREAVGPTVGVNVDPSHLFWQGIDPIAAIRELGKHGAIYHFHAKDNKIDQYNTAINGVLDTRHYSDEVNRSWKFRSVGCGHDVLFWKNVAAELRLAGYEGILSIEHEDGMMSMMEGLKQAISTLQASVMTEPRQDMFWA